jgi:hypothetical protein
MKVLLFQLTAALSVTYLPQPAPCASMLVGQASMFYCPNGTRFVYNTQDLLQSVNATNTIASVGNTSISVPSLNQVSQLVLLLNQTQIWQVASSGLNNSMF